LLRVKLPELLVVVELPATETCAPAIAPQDLFLTRPVIVPAPVVEVACQGTVNALAESVIYAFR
jgi:hypothetical protein